MVGFEVKGNMSKTQSYLNKLQSLSHNSIFDKYGQEGVIALSEATPKNTGLTASSWYYKVEYTKDGAVISWNNSNTNNGVNIAMILQYGHGTGTGGYVTGIDYINPAMEPVFTKILEDAWKEVRSL